jgi:integrase
LAILEKYKTHPCYLIRGKLLPVPANSNYNVYLKEIATSCGITKNLTTHLARHTFATIAHKSGIPVEIIAKILGHSTTKMTLRYAKTSDSMVKSAMFGANNSLNTTFENIVKTPVECD